MRLKISSLVHFVFLGCLWGATNVFAADCTTATVGSPYSTCYDIYTHAGITQAQFNSYNPGIDCTLIQPGQKVCVSAGTLPSSGPKASANGTCYEYFPVLGDSCSAIATKFTITTANIEAYNTNTYKWKGCALLQPGWAICVGPGTPPPIPVNPALECGPQTTGNKTCPLNACCSAFGYCGLTDDFCVGTTANPCISNCGQPAIPTCTNSATRKLGYYEGWAAQRTCTAVTPDQLDLTGYTHMHFAFATISQTYQIQLAANDIPNLQALVKRKSDISGLKVVIAVGGWAFSTDQPTKDLFTVMISTSANRATFISSVKSFLTQYGVDGIDIDFEYPAAFERQAPATDTPNLTSLMSEMKAGLPAGAIISVATPAGYWFLKGFEINKIASSLTYMNMMSYDYHGPWDTNITGQPPVTNPQSSILDMKTSTALYVRAGIDLHKVNLGLAWYGRTYKLANAACVGYNCTMTGGGTQGPCTQASGVLAQFEIISRLGSTKPTLDTASQTYWFNNGGDLITFDQADTWKAKSDYAGSTCFGGTFIWSNDQVTPTALPPPTPPTGCTSYDFSGWANSYNTACGSEYKGGLGDCGCWDSANWHTWNGVETYINYIWQFNLKGSSLESQIMGSAPWRYNSISQAGNQAIGTATDSHDDILWAALMLIKGWEYETQVAKDTNTAARILGAVPGILNWVEQKSSKNTGCNASPGIYQLTDSAYQNTVVNALYINVLLKLYLNGKNSSGLSVATNYYQNFIVKYKLNDSTSGLYVDGIGSDCKPTGPTWTYNQGLMLSNFGYFYQATKDPVWIANGKWLLTAVRKNLVNGGILAEPCSGGDGGGCSADQDGFKGIFMKHMMYFYDSVGRDPSLLDHQGWFTDWMGLNVRGINQYAKFSNGHLGNVWYSNTGLTVHQNGWTDISAFSAAIAAAKYGTCSGYVPPA